MPAMDRIYCCLCAIAVIGASCTSQTGRSFVPTVTGYSEKHREVLVLNDQLLEISGLVNIGDERFAAINDEDGELFFINVRNDSVAKYRFKGKGDYEELVKVNNTYYVLESSGNIIEISPQYGERETFKFPGKGMEFESMAYYPKGHKLVLITKDQKKAKAITAWSFNLNTRQYDPQPLFEIQLKEVYTILANFNADCKPSGAAINPVNNKLYIVASVGRVLMECTQEGKIIKIYKLNPTHFPQPEGITFAANGDMYISNEGADGKATILKYPYGGHK
jgi:hypothetical protein